MEGIKPYKKGVSYSYTLGAFPTYELLKSRPEIVECVYIHSSFTDRKGLEELCETNHIPLVENDRIIARLSDKENVFVIGVFHKYLDILDNRAPQVVLVNPSNMGNMGTILRTCLGFGVKDLAFISPAVDVFHPKTVRASMGALFKLRHRYFDSFAAYRQANPDQQIYTFMLTGKTQLTIADCPKTERFALVFGNEASGLPPEYETYGTSILIPQSPEVDSLNLTIAVGIGVYMFTH